MTKEERRFKILEIEKYRIDLNNQHSEIFIKSLIVGINAILTIANFFLGCYQENIINVANIVAVSNLYYTYSNLVQTLGCVYKRKELKANIKQIETSVNCEQQEIVNHR